MAGTTPRSTAFAQANHLRCADFCEFDQAAYIQQCLHDNQPGTSPLAQGVCCALVLETLGDWLNSGYSRKDLVDQFVLDCNPQNTDHPTAQPTIDISDRLQQGHWHDVSLNELQTSTGLTPAGSVFYTTAASLLTALAAPPRNDPSLLALGGLVSAGHAIAIRADTNTVFDPNVGYYQTADTTNFITVMTNILALYPQRATAMTIWNY
jgi:hypothetical protein